MALDSVDTLVYLLRRFQLLDADRLDEVGLLADGAFQQPLALLKELVRRGWLTPYQGTQLVHGDPRTLRVGRYHLLDRLGEGGVSQVFKAWDSERERIVALKVIHEELTANPEAVGRFRREIDAVRRLAHPHIVRAFGAGRDGEVLWLAMEFIAGTDLARLVRSDGPLPAPRAARYLRHAALGLQHAHEHGVIHRDVKPANLLLAADADLVKVVDLGLSRPRRAVEALTADGSLIGSPDFMSPEQARRPRTVGICSDIYSLGCTAYYLLTGRVPFPGNSLVAKVTAHEKQEALPLEQVRPGTPPALAAVVRRMMAKKPEDRYPTPEAAANALMPFAG
jgi:serine/threonine protein kinase